MTFFSPKNILLLAFAVASVVLPASSTTFPLPAELLVKFPSDTWIENIAVRSNGMLLGAELITQARLYQINPFVDNPDPVLVHQFDNTASALGITEIADDVFCVASSNFSIPLLKGYGENYLYTVDFNGVDPQKPGSAKVRMLANITEAQGLNGLAFVGGDSSTVLVTDIILGVIFGVDLKTGKYEVAINNTYTRAPGGIGANGMKVVGNELYFSVTSSQTIVKVPIDSTGHPTGKFTTLIKGQVTPDDFAVDSQGDVYAASISFVPNGVQALAFVPREGGNATFLAGMKGPTAAAFGRTKADAKTLYVSTNGGASKYFDGKPIKVSGKIFKVEVGRTGVAPNITSAGGKYE